MKKRNLFLTIGLCLTLGVSAVATLSTSNFKPIETKADATTRLYLDMSLNSDWYSSDATFKVHTWNSANSDKYFPATKVDNESSVYYYADVDLSTYSSGGGYRFSRFSSDGKTEWTRGEWNSYSSGVKTYYKVAAGNYEQTSGTWSSPETNWKIIGGRNNWATTDIEIPITNFKFDKDGYQYYNISVELPTGSAFKVLGGENDYKGWDNSSFNTLTKKYLSGTTGSNISVTVGGTFEVYVKPVLGTYWIQVDSATEIHKFSVDFKAATKSICETGHTYDDHSSALSGIWEAQQTAWSALTQGAKNLFKNGASSEDAEINDAFLRYRHIVTRYTGLFDFAEVVRTSSAINTNSNQQGLSSSTVIIVVGISITLVAVASFFAIRKRREQE